MSAPYDCCWCGWRVDEDHHATGRIPDGYCSGVCEDAHRVAQGLAPNTDPENDSEFRKAYRVALEILLSGRDVA